VILTRIQPGKYREERSWRNYITFASPDDQYVSLVMLWRLAAFCRDMRVKSPLTIGFRSAAEQQQLYNIYMAGKGNPAAKPGSSWHEASCAVDMREAAEAGWFKRFSETWLMPVSATKQGLNAYGLIAPLNRADKPNGPIEWWHWQPCETNGYIGNRMEYLQADDAVNGRPQSIRMGSVGTWVIELQWLLGQRQTGIFDANLDAVVRKFQLSLGLTSDGVVGPKTWTVLYR